MAKTTRALTVFDFITMFGAIKWATATWPRVAALFTGGIVMIDISAIVVPAEYQIAIAITAIISLVIFGFWTTMRLHEKAVDNKLAIGKIKDRNDLPYDNVYIAGSIIGAIVGGILGVIFTCIFIPNCVIGAGMWTYVFVVFFLTAFLTVGCIYATHGLFRIFIKEVKEYAYIAREAGDDITEGLTDAQKQAVVNFINSLGVKKQ